MNRRSFLQSLMTVAAASTVTVMPAIKAVTLRPEDAIIIDVDTAHKAAHNTIFGTVDNGVSWMYFDGVNWQMM